MRNVLILVTESMEPLNDVVIAAQGNLPDARVEVMDLTVDAPDYGAVVEKVFAADSVQVW